MALPKAYLTSAKNLSAILNAIQTAKAPEKFTQRFLENLEFKSPNDRLIIGVLKALKFLTEEGRPTDRYFRYLDQTQAPHVLAEGIREAYDDLFQINKNAQTLSKQEVMNKFKTLSQGSLSESVLDKMGSTFVELCKLADFSAALTPGPAQATLQGHKPSVKVEPVEPIETRKPEAQPVPGGKLKIGEFVYNIQIVLPESRDQAVYDALFRSMREHLI